MPCIKEEELFRTNIVHKKCNDDSKYGSGGQVMFVGKNQGRKQGCSRSLRGYQETSGAFQEGPGGFHGRFMSTKGRTHVAAGLE